MTRIIPLAMLVPLLAGCLLPAANSPTVHVLPPGKEEALLWNDVYANLRIQPYYVDGYEPSGWALDALRTTAVDVTGKVTVTLEPAKALGGVTPDQDRTRTAQDVQDFHLSQFGQSAHQLGVGDTALLAVFYMDGRYVDSDTHDAVIFGIQSGHEIYVFLDAYGGDLHLPLPARERAERAILIHEFGHALGLVDCGIPMVVDHADPETRCHSSNRDSVMSTNGVAQPGPVMDLVVDGSVPYTFDEDDLRDIQAFQALSVCCGPTA